ncbi:MAG: hypothetical protein IJV32_00290 [Bacteroidales bacterium]|nr:hypothetical protein [Bacteroidales bacterium]
MRVEMDEDLRELIESGQNRKYRLISKNETLLLGLMRAYQIMEAVNNTDELKMFSFLHYEKLRHEYSGLSSVRLHNRYVHRLIFEEKEDLLTLKLIEIDDTHYGNKK